MGRYNGKRKEDITRYSLHLDRQNRFLLLVLSINIPFWYDTRFRCYGTGHQETYYRTCQ